MARIILEMQCSLDGFMSGPRGELDWMFPDMDAEFTAWSVERLWRAAAHLMGAVTYRNMAAHWPVSSEPFAEPMNRIPKIVFSSSIRHPEWQETEVIAGDLVEQITKLKHERPGELLAHGGLRFAQSLIRAQLIDEYRLMVHPVALGRGQSIFADLVAPLRLAPFRQTAFKSGLVAIELLADRAEASISKAPPGRSLA